MKLTLSFNLPDEMVQATQAVHANIAWTSISEALQVIRNHQKHGHRTAEETIQDVKEILFDAKDQMYS